MSAQGLTWDQVRAALLNYAPLSNSPAGAIYAWPRRAMTLEEVEATSGIYKASITWASLSYQYAFKVGGQQQQIRCDISLTNSYGNVPGDPMFVPGAKGTVIGWDKRTVHGCSIYVPVVTWTESIEVPASQWSFDYEAKVTAMNQAPVNNATFRGYPAGDVLFQGMQANASTQNPDFVTASYEFSMSKGNYVASGNALTIGSITNIEKAGWDWLDVCYIFDKSQDETHILAFPDYVLVHQVYHRSSFAVLNIGTGTNLPLWGAA